MNRIDIYITDLEIPDTLSFPMLPEKITVKTGTAFQNYDIMSLGEVKLPYGEKLTSFSWKGILPGYSRRRTTPAIGLIKMWKDPKEIQSLWSVYRVNKKKLRLLITETPINHDVYLDNYSVDYQNGYGDYYYQITFIHAKELKISLETKNGENTQAKSGEPSQQRPEPPKKTTYTVKSGDTLWGIAEKHLGNGSMYTDIHKANQPPLGSDPNLIYPGQVLTIPT